MSVKRILKFFSTFMVVLILFLPSCTQFGQLRENIVNKFSSEDELDKAILAVENFFNAIVEKDYKSAYEYISSDDKQDNSFKDFKNEFRNVTDIISFEINWVEVKSNIAIVCIDFVDSYDGEEKVYNNKEVSLVKEEDGSWKVKFWK
ncbi:MAG: hypothetical protein ACQEP2_04615 [Actinomycetota bacterium]